MTAKDSTDSRKAKKTGSGVRVITVSSVCLLDKDACRTADYVAGMIEQAALNSRHDLIVAPLTPFLSFREGSEQQDISVFAGIARQYRTYLAVAMTEHALDGRLFLSSVLLDRNGRIAGKYRKTHALPDDEMALGDDLPVFETDFAKIGMSIGTDFYFPEVYAVERMKGAEILVWQHHSERFREHSQWPPLLKARAIDSRAYLVTAMYADPHCYLTNRHRAGMRGAAWGRSMIINRVGTTVADTGYDDGYATAMIDLDKRKIDPHAPYRRDENIFLVNNEGDRKAFQPLAEPWQPPETPVYKKRLAKIAVGCFFNQDENRNSVGWTDDNMPEKMFQVLDKAAELKPDIVLLSEMAARNPTEIASKAAEMVADRARRMNAYILIGGLDIEPRPENTRSNSYAVLWDRTGKRVFKESIYWTHGFPEIKVFDTDFARIGVHLCGDLYVGEVDRVLGLKGAEIIFDSSGMWGADGYNNEMLLRARAIDNNCWIACAHWNTSDSGMRSLIADPYGCVVRASQFQEDDVITLDINFEKEKVYYAGNNPKQPDEVGKRIAAYFSADMPEQLPGRRAMMLERRRPELYGILPTTNETTKSLLSVKTIRR